MDPIELCFMIVLFFDLLLWKASEVVDSAFAALAAAAALFVRLLLQLEASPAARIALG
jgi:hypothetical protein